jgi:lipoprotein-anchoring transpeptidase ErfK/SrfK
MAIAIVAWGCATATLPPTTIVGDLSAIEGRWNCIAPQWFASIPITHMRIQAQSAEVATMTLVWRANPDQPWSITMRQGVAVIGYPHGGAARLPLQRAVDGAREFLIAVDDGGHPWLECQRPLAGPS